MYLLIWIFLIILGLFIRNSKSLTFLQIGYAVFLISTNIGNPDQHVYLDNIAQVHGSLAGIFSGNVIFNIILYIASLIDQYSITMGIVSIIAFIFLYNGVKYYTDNTSLVMSMYLISPFVIDGTQIKNFLAMSVWVFFSVYLYKSFQVHKFNKDTIIYLIGAAICTGIHFSFIFTFLYIFIILINKKNVLTTSIFLCMAGLSMYLIVKNIDGIVAFLAQGDVPTFELLSQKFDAYSLTYNIYGASARLKATVIFFILIGCVLLSMRFLIKDKQQIMMLNFITYLTMISLLILPLIQYSMEIYRMQRDLLLLYYTYFAMNIQGKIIDWKNNKLYVYKIVPIVFGVMVGLYYLTFDGNSNVFNILFKL